jgi:hypothetical protein
LIGSYLLNKEEQELMENDTNWLDEFELD